MNNLYDKFGCNIINRKLTNNVPAYELDRDLLMDCLGLKYMLQTLRMKQFLESFKDDDICADVKQIYLSYKEFCRQKKFINVFHSYYRFEHIYNKI